MKLRNKKTGEIKEYTHTMTSYHVPIKGGYEIFTPWYPEEWEELEDVKEPLIKNEKIRKVFREWADLIGAERFRVNHLCKFGRTIITGEDLTTEPVIELPGYIGEDSEIYTKVELCGEEEE